MDKRVIDALNGQSEFASLGGDLISREALIERMDLVNWYDGKGSLGATDEESAYVRWVDVVAVMESALAVEAVPVVHGRWVDNGIPDSMLSGCSVCGFSCGAYTFNYCPNCGAKMDGERKEK